MERRQRRGRAGLGHEAEDVVRIRRQPMLGGLARAWPPDRPQARSAGARRARERRGRGSLRSRCDERAQGARWQVRERRDRRAADRQRLGAVEREAGERRRARPNRADPSSRVRATPMARDAHVRIRVAKRRRASASPRPASLQPSSARRAAMRVRTAADASSSGRMCRSARAPITRSRAMAVSRRRSPSGPSDARSETSCRVSLAADRRMTTA